MQQFDLKLTKTNPQVSMAKLWFLSPRHAELRAQSDGTSHEEMVDLLHAALRKSTKDHIDATLPIVNGDRAKLRQYLSRVIKADSKNYTNALGFIKGHPYFFLQKPPQPPAQVWIPMTQSALLVIENPHYEHWSQDKIRSKLLEELTPLVNSWHHDSLNQAVLNAIDHFTGLREGLVEIENTKDGARVLMTKWLWQSLRGYVAFGCHGPSLIETMSILGPDIVLDRIKNVEVTWKLPKDSQESVEKQENNDRAAPGI
jgi:hypothetical protein